MIFCFTIFRRYATTPLFSLRRLYAFSHAMLLLEEAYAAFFDI